MGTSEARSRAPSCNLYTDGLVVFPAGYKPLAGLCMLVRVNRVTLGDWGSRVQIPALRPAMPIIQRDFGTMERPLSHRKGDHAKDDSGRRCPWGGLGWLHCVAAIRPARLARCY